MELESFDQWLKYVFDHSENDRDWYFSIDDDDWWNPRDKHAIALNYLTQLFENTSTAISAYSDAQISHGLWFIASASSEYITCLLDEMLDWKARERAFNAIYNVFENFFVQRCTPHLSHTFRKTPADVNPLNVTCYMCWDQDWIIGQPNDPTRQKTDALVLDIMARTLKLPSLACQESALHGLGHWNHSYPTQVQAIIDAFLKREPTMNAELKAYALAARRDYVE